jgi:DNA-binding response OmpR family regulator
MAAINRRGRVLLVEDDARVARALAQALHEEGYDVLVALDGVSAIRRIAYDHIDALIVDLELPNADAVPVAEFARSREPRVPLLFMSTCPDVEALRCPRFEPAPSIVAKPVALEALSAILHSTDRTSSRPSTPLA